MSLKVGLYIVNQLHAITQAGYEVKFCGDFEGMIRIEYYKEYEPNFYEHDHLGSPGGQMDRLENAIIGSLERFRETYDIKSE